MARAIKVKTPLGNDMFRFERMSGHEKLSGGFEYQVSLLSENHKVDLSALLGQAITIEIELPKSGHRYFHGHVVSFTMNGETSRYSRYHLVMRPWTYLMSLNSNCRVFQNSTVPQILKILFDEWHFSDVRNALTETYRTLEYCVQYRESDFNFISRLMERDGIYYFFEHIDGKHTIVLADALSAHVPTPNYEEVTYFAPGESHQHHDDTLNSWGSGRQIRPGSFSSTDFDPTRPRAALLARLNNKKDSDHNTAEIYEYPGEYPRSPEAAGDDVKAAEGTKHVQVRLAEHQADFEVASASGTVQGLGAGSLFKLTLHPRSDQNQKYIVVSATYDIGGNAHETDGSGGPEFAGTYTCINSTVSYRAPCETPRPRVDGPQTAFVVGQKGQEIWTDPLGRVKVQFHWDQLGKRDESSSCWVRVAQVWAGAGWGGIHIPRINQEVIVDFLEGDPDRPIITGRVYNGVNTVPYTLPDNKTQSGIKSRSTLGGTQNNFNEIRFEDLKGKEELFVQAERNHTVHVKVNRSLSVGGNETISVGGNRETTVTGKDAVTVKKDHSMTVLDLARHTFKMGNIVDIFGEDQDIFIEKGKTEFVTKIFSMESDEQIVLKVGGSTITLTPDKIDLTSPTVSINGATVVEVVGGLVKLNC